jgi:predicted RNase H-like HicB family nuclease
MRYAVVIEKGERNYSAYVPDLPGCVSVGDTLEEAKAGIRDAIEFHLAGMREDGSPIPKPSSRAGNVEVEQAAEVIAAPKGDSARKEPKIVPAPTFRLVAWFNQIEG